jgi:hypothetical protein
MPPPEVVHTQKGVALRDSCSCSSHTHPICGPVRRPRIELLEYGYTLVMVTAMVGWTIFLGWMVWYLADGHSAEGARMDNDERERGLLLLRQILDAGGTVHAYDNVDHRPYMRMQKQRWLTGRNLGDRVIYEVTEAGRQALLK